MNLKKLSISDAHIFADTLLKKVDEIHESEQPELAATKDEFVLYHHQLNSLVDSGNFAGQILDRLKSAKVFTLKYSLPVEQSAETAEKKKPAVARAVSVSLASTERTIRVPSLTPTSSNDISRVKMPTLVGDNVGADAPRPTQKQAA